MASANFVLIDKITVGAAGASSITFSNIPQTGYTDLVVKFSVRGTAGAVSRSVYLTFNGSATSYSEKYIQGDGTAASSGSNIGSGAFIYAGECDGGTATTSTFGNQELYIPNYTSSNYKSVSIDAVSETNATTIYSTLVAGLWSNTAAITSMSFTLASGNIGQYSTFYLYGVAKLGTTPAIVPYATGGDTIMTDGTYWYHAFKSSGTFTPTKGLSCDVLVVAGGGGGGQAHGGGGGAGGLYYSASNSVTATGYTVTVGAGGAGSTTSSAGTNGSNSVFGALTAAIGGGGGGTYNGTGTSAGSNGGSGGGGSNYPGNTVYSGGTATSGQGYAGGNSSGNLAGGGGGGGGGSGAVGNNGTNQGTLSQGGGQGGTGGAGVNTYSTWLSATGLGVSGYIAGGGGGGSYSSPTYTTYTASAGGSGGGGAGGYVNASYTPQASVAATANTGSGGGGGSGNGGTGSAGGSGLVVLRYAI